jgi:hypothetical protein
VILSKNEVCIEDDGSKLCKFPYTRGGADNVCETVLAESSGFVMEGNNSYAVIYTDMAE